MKFLEMLYHLFKGLKVHSKNYLKGDYFVLKDNKLMFGGPNWNEITEGEFAKEDMGDDTWEILKDGSHKKGCGDKGEENE